MPCCLSTHANPCQSSPIKSNQAQSAKSGPQSIRHPTTLSQQCSFMISCMLLSCCTSAIFLLWQTATSYHFLLILFLHRLSISFPSNRKVVDAPLCLPHVHSACPHVPRVRLSWNLKVVEPCYAASIDVTWILKCLYFDSNSISIPAGHHALSWMCEVLDMQTLWPTNLLRRRENPRMVCKKCVWTVGKVAIELWFVLWELWSPMKLCCCLYWLCEAHAFGGHWIVFCLLCSMRLRWSWWWCRQCLYRTDMFENDSMMYFLLIWGFCHEACEAEGGEDTTGAHSRGWEEKPRNHEMLQFKSTLPFSLLQKISLYFSSSGSMFVS